MAGEHNDDLGASFLTPHDSEWRKIKNFTRELDILSRIWASSAFAAHHWSTLAIYHGGEKGKGRGWGPFRGSTLVGRARVSNWLGYGYQAQAEREQVGDVLHICNEWKRDSDSTVYVASNCEEVELFRNNTSLGKIKPNYLTDLPHGIFKWENVKWSDDSRLVAKGYNNGEVTKEYTRYASSYAGEDSLKLTPTTGTDIVADGVDLTYLIAEIKDKNGQQCFYGDGNLMVDPVSGPGKVFMYGEPIWMADGRAGFYIRSIKDKTGTVRVQAKAEIGTLINNDATGTALNKFDYQPAGAWKQINNVNDALKQDLHYSDKTDACFEIKFTGTQIRWYGEVKTSHGIAAISIDGGSEKKIDCFTQEKYVHEKSIPRYRLFKSKLLPNGPHTLRVRVTGRKNKDSSGTGIATDSVKIFTGKYSLKSNVVTINVAPMTEIPVPLP